MNIQIFGTKKCFDTKKAQRYFKERRIKFQFIDLADKGISRGELLSVISSVGSLDMLINEKYRDGELLALIKYLTDDAKIEKVLDYPEVLKTPIVRNGKKATVGNCPDIWKKWENE